MPYGPRNTGFVQPVKGCRFWIHGTVKASMMFVLASV